MKKILLGLIISLSSIQASCQQLLFANKVSIDTLYMGKHQVLPIINNKALTLFLFDKKQINGLKFSEKFELEDSYSVDKQDNSYGILLGHSVDASGYHLFFSKKNKKEFLSKTININGKVVTDDIPLSKLKGEKFLNSISCQNSFYLLTVTKFSSILNMYVFKGNKLAEKKTFDFSEFKFSDSDYPDIYDAVRNIEEPTMNSEELKIQKIEADKPNSIDLVAEKNKLYYHDHCIFMTFDTELENTKMIIIDLNNYESKVVFYDQINIESEDSTKTVSNSFLFKNYLYQIKGNNHNLGIQIKDMKKDSVLQSYRIKANEEISFKNTPVTQNGSNIFGGEKDLDKTKRILRRITEGNVGIAVEEAYEGTILTMGGSKSFHSRGGQAMMTTMGATSMSINGVNGTFPVSFNTQPYFPLYYGYRSYTYTKSVLFKSIIDPSNFKHLAGEVSENIYDKIEDYEKAMGDKITMQTIVKIGADYVFGYHLKADGKYYLIQFHN